MTEDEIRERFTHPQPSIAGAQRLTSLSNTMIVAAEIIDELCPDGREKALVFTKLQEADMWACASIARGLERG